MGLLSKYIQVPEMRERYDSNIIILYITYIYIYIYICIFIPVFFFRILTTEIQNIPASVYFAAIATLILKVESEKSKYHELQQKITLAVLQSVCKFKKDE